MFSWWHVTFEITTRKVRKNWNRRLVMNELPNGSSWNIFGEIQARKHLERYVGRRKIHVLLIETVICAWQTDGWWFDSYQKIKVPRVYYFHLLDTLEKTARICCIFRDIQNHKNKELETNNDLETIIGRPLCSDQTNWNSKIYSMMLSRLTSMHWWWLCVTILVQIIEKLTIISDRFPSSP